VIIEMNRRCGTAMPSGLHHCGRGAHRPDLEGLGALPSEGTRTTGPERGRHAPGRAAGAPTSAVRKRKGVRRVLGGSSGAPRGLRSHSRRA
jgi:hypothetical protein